MSKALFPILQECMRLDKASGALIWNVRPSAHFKGSQDPAVNARLWRAWNLRYSNRPVCLSADAAGYMAVRLTIDGKLRYIKAHRIIFALHAGSWPEKDLDHINGDRSDNRIENLREVTRAENARNSKLRSDNTSGAVGVYLHNPSRLWMARMNVDKKQHVIGYFKTKAEAVAASKNARKNAPFTDRHGAAE